MVLVVLTNTARRTNYPVRHCFKLITPPSHELLRRFACRRCSWGGISCRRFIIQQEPA
jgi:hypothetical protein